MMLLNKQSFSSFLEDDENAKVVRRATTDYVTKRINGHKKSNRTITKFLNTIGYCSRKAKKPFVEPFHMSDTAERESLVKEVVNFFLSYPEK